MVCVLCNLLADNAREYIMTADYALVGWFDLGCMFVLASVIALLNNFVVKYAIGVIMISIWIWRKCNIVKEESILIVRDLGVQVKTVYMDGRCISRFIDHSRIADIIINEGITMLQVKFYMAIIVEGQDRMVIVFEHLLPRLKVLLKVYRGTRAIIFNETDEPMPPNSFV